ncbi:isopeptide-forming domain-containing fimbrial protein [Plantibacter flavus]|uniref:DUF5979 domain-containing protein n=1 Tax=Plantibacter flavus TaxID=150123 RepID=UPI003F13CE1E
MRRRSRLLALFTSIVVATGLMSLTAPAAFAEGPSEVTLLKEVSTPNVVPGETFSYDLTVGCSALDTGTGCTNAVLTDPIPEGFEILAVDVGQGVSAADPVITGNTVTVTFTDQLEDPAGAVGLMDSSTGVVTITVRVRDDFPFAQSGLPVPNTGTLNASNAIAPANSTAIVTPTVERTLLAGAEKSFAPASAANEPGTATTATLIGRNASNGPVDRLVVTDPIDPTAAPNPFQYLGVTALGQVTLPEGADRVQVDVWDGTDWVIGSPAATATLPDGVDPASIGGLRFTFDNSGGAQLPLGATATIDVDLEQRENVAGIAGPTDVANVVTATVVLGDESDDASATGVYSIVPTVVDVAATKSFEPDAIVHGESSTVTTTVTNDSTDAVTSLSITEPSGSSIPEGIEFDAFTTGVVWPMGATGASVTWTYRDGTTETIAAGAADTLPAPATGKQVAGYTVTFTGTIAAGAEATVPFGITTDPDFAPTPFVWDNLIEGSATAVDGTVGTTTASDQLTIYDEHLAVEVAKRIAPASILSVPGSPATVLLPTELLPFPASTTNADQIVVQDPQVLPAVPSPNPWWNSFDATAITQTAIPANATLTVQYWDGTQFVDLPGATGVAGPRIFSMPIPAELRGSIQGLRFQFDSEIGFAPGTKVQPNFGVALRADKRDASGAAAGGDDVIENCAAAGASAANIDPATGVTAVPCPTITLIPVEPGQGDLIEKTFLESSPGAGQTVIARSGDSIPARIDWSTGGYADLDTVVISDTADPATTPVEDTVFNAFNVTGVDPITAEQDPWLQYDQVLRVELYDGDGWVEAQNDPCPGACDGTFPGVSFTAAEQASTVGVRLVFAESPTRAATIGDDPTAPQVGSGVARSIGNDRSFVLDFQVRDLVRVPVTDPDPAVGSREYNAGPGTPGQVVNTARASGLDSAGDLVVTDVDSDTVTLIDVPLNVQVDKTWTGGPLGIPPLGTDQAFFPSGRASIVATNVTAAKVDSLSITEPNPDSTSAPFDVFNIKGFVTISQPAGTVDTVVELTASDGSVQTVSRTTALGMTEAQLVDVVSVRVLHTGRIDSGAQATLTLDTRLRATHRSTDAPVTVADSAVANDTVAQVADLGGSPDSSPTATDDASMVLQAMSISVTAGKTFNTVSQQEPNRAPITMTLSGRPGGSVRAVELVLTDDAGTFWNAFDYVGLAPQITLTAPINRVQMDVCVGRDFSDVSLDCVASGGTWVNGTARTASQFNASPLPDSVAASDVEGVRYTFTRADGAFWENPASPLQQVPVAVQRRVDLRSGGEVPSTLAGNQPAPGESAAGVFSNRVVADVTGALTGGEGAPALTATDDADATVGYIHSNNAVTVAKTPTGVQSPGRVINYGLAVTNSGNTPIVNPVVTDRLPSDAGGVQLIFDPAADPASSPYSYALTGAAPSTPNGPALPTDGADVTASVNSGADVITFTFPEGSVLEVGQTYRITVQLVFRPGLTANTVVTNTMGVTGDRAWDACSGRLDATTGECRTNTSVTVQLAGAIRGVKTVKADDTELGTNAVNGAVDCKPNQAGFYRGGCVPVTKPGGTETWRAVLTNVGTLPMNRMVAIDRLPKVGDTGANSALPRRSEWQPSWTGVATLAVAGPTASMTTYYTTAANPCVSDLNTTGAQCAPGSWLVWDSAAAAAVDPATVTSLKFVVDFGTALPPAGTVSIDLQTRTPAYSPTAGPDTIAWNTIAVAGRTVSGQTIGTTPATEGNKVGVALATGPLEALKELAGDGAERYAPATFTGDVTCVSVGEDIPVRPITLSADGTPVSVPDLPWGAECTIAEDDNGQTSEQINTVTIVRPPQTVPVVIATNTYDLAGLVVEKSVATDAVDQDGTPVSYGPFDVAVQCLFLDEPVYADGFSAETPMTATLADGESASFTGLPARADCTVTETDPKGAVSTSITMTTADGAAEPVDATDAPVTLTADADGEPTNTASIVNGFADGALEITKVVTGPGAELYGAGPFVVHAVCTLTDDSGTRVVWDGDVTLGGDLPLVATIEHLAAGAVCAMTETQTGGADIVDIASSADPIAPDATVGFTVTNTFLLGSLEVTKAVAGDGAERYGQGVFTVQLSCVRTVDGESVAVEIPGGPTREVSIDGGLIADFDALPVGAECRIVESLSGGATNSIITIGSGEGAETGSGTEGVETTIQSDATLAATITNVFEVGSITVTKELAGAAAAANADKTFTVALSCLADVDGESAAVEIPGGAERTLSRDTGLTAEYAELPVGAECELVETDAGGATSTAITPNDGDAAVGVVTVAAGEAATIAVVNTFDPAPVVPADPGSALTDGSLSSTGFAGAWLWIVGGVLALLGALLLVLSGRRRRGSAQ